MERVDGNRPIDDVTESIVDAIQSRMAVRLLGLGRMTDR